MPVSGDKRLDGKAVVPNRHPRRCRAGRVGSASPDGRLTPAFADER
jgi:hypothetical protein